MRNSSIRFNDPNKDKTLFFTTLRKAVDDYFKEQKLSKHYDGYMILKTVVLFAAYFLPFLTILIFNPPLWLNLGLWMVMGFAMSGIGMSVMHDANHGAYSNNPKVNQWLGYSINLLGGSVANWKMQHNLLHHTFTNITYVDDDIADKLIIKLSPHTEVKWYHKFQFIYAFGFYAIVTLYWATLKDFFQFRRYIKDGVNKNSKSENTKIMLSIVFGKILYFAIFIFVPIFVFSIPVMHVLLGFLLMHFLAGVILTVIFQLAHTVEGTSHPMPNDNNEIETNWAIHQLNTTVNFATSNKFLTWYLGGLNFQVEHHLFPNVCHIHYPAISKIVKPICQQFDVPYLENKGFFEAIGSHIRTLNRFSQVRVPDLNEAIN
ncbi:MAG: acyl-CoA desaturase [Saprospiraceae bacterium]|nr:acyl-CoA desaturase [Saprospiraceae bacterium]MBK9630691.1 acyl-CoA desaturase [Saprospiraceae bacterium]